MKENRLSCIIMLLMLSSALFLGCDRNVTSESSQRNLVEVQEQREGVEEQENIPNRITQPSPNDERKLIPITKSEFKDYSLSGPYTHKNLSLFLIHGKNRIEADTFLSLNEAMEKNVLTIYETGTVNQLEVENVSDASHVYIQSGDIIKGGKQDRTLTYDMVLSPKSGRVPLKSFCVESGRWTRRGSEAVGQFNDNSALACSLDLKKAVRVSQSQQQVWENVSKMQAKLSSNVGVSVQDERSSTSLQLTMENDKLKETRKEYLEKLESVPSSQQENVIGFAFTINGKINSAEVYASDKIFKKMWKKLIEATVTEAFAEYQKDATFESLDAKQVQTFLQKAEAGEAKGMEINQRNQAVEMETDTSCLFESRDMENKGEWIHRSYIHH